MSAPTEKHRFTADNIVGNAPIAIAGGAFIELSFAIAAALANAEREGMKRAAEHIRAVSDAMWERTEKVRWENDNEVTNQEAEDASVAYAFQRAAEMILSEAERNPNSRASSRADKAEAVTPPAVSATHNTWSPWSVDKGSI